MGIKKNASMFTRLNKSTMLVDVKNECASKVDVNYF